MRLSIVAGATGLLGLVAAAVGLGGPYWVGLKAEHYYDSVLRDQLRLYNIDPKNIVYRRGWFDSSSRISINIPGKGVHGKPETVSLVSKIRHGPLVYQVSGSPVLAYAVVDTTVDLPPAVEAPLHRYFGDRAPVRATTVVAFDGTSKTYISSPAVTGTSPNGKVRVQWHGLEGSVTTSHDNDYTFNISVPRLLLKGNGGVVDVGAIRTSGRGHRLDATLWQSDSSISLAKVTFDIPTAAGGRGAFSLTGLTVSEHVAPKKGGLSSRVDVRLDTIGAGGSHFGPGRYTMEVRNVSRSAVAKYTQLIRKLQAMRRQGRGKGEIMAHLRGNLNGLLGEFLRSSPQLEISRASLGTEQGEAAGRLLVSFDGGGTFDVNNVPMLIGRIHAKAHLAMPAGLFKGLLVGFTRKQVIAALKARKQAMPDEATMTAMADNEAEKELKVLTADGLIASEGGRYAAALSFENRRFTVNGHPVGPILGL